MPFLTHTFSHAYMYFRIKPNLNPDWSKIIEKVKTQLNLNRIQKVPFIGHACAIGESPYNKILSKKRAVKIL